MKEATDAQVLNWLVRVRGDISAAKMLAGVEGFHVTRVQWFESWERFHATRHRAASADRVAG